MVDVPDREQKPRKRVVKVFESGMQDSRSLGKYTLHESEDTFYIQIGDDIIVIQEYQSGVRQKSFHLTYPQDAKKLDEAKQ